MFFNYNVGVSIAGGDAPVDEITEAAFDRIATIKLRGAIMACKHVLPLIGGRPRFVPDFARSSF